MLLPVRLSGASTPSFPLGSFSQVVSCSPREGLFSFPGGGKRAGEHSGGVRSCDAGCWAGGVGRVGHRTPHSGGELAGFGPTPALCSAGSGTSKPPEAGREAGSEGRSGRWRVRGPVSGRRAGLEAGANPVGGGKEGLRGPGGLRWAGRGKEFLWAGRGAGRCSPAGRLGG